MQILLLLFTLMTFGTLVLFKNVLVKSGVSFGIVGIIICALTPLNLEATYWIGASTRFVPGMFFSILSCYMLVEWIHGKFRKRYGGLILYAVFNIISTGFYEQIVVFNFVFTLAIIILNYRKIKELKKVIISVPFLSTVLIGVYYIAFWNKGKVASRGEMASSGIVEHFLSTFKGVANLILPKNVNMIVTGTKGYFAIERHFLQYIALILVAAFAIYCVFRLLKPAIKAIGPLGKYETLLKLAGGMILALAPFAPFFILKNNYMSFRAVYPSIFGIALFFDGLADWLAKNKAGRYVTAILAGVVCMVFFMANVTEINNYRLIEADDDIIADNFLMEFEAAHLNDKQPIYVLGIQYLYTETSRTGYENIASSDWAFLGKLNAESDKFYFTNLTPVPDGAYVDLEKLKEANIFGMDEQMNVVRLTYMEEDHMLYGNNRIFGSLSSEGDDGRLKLIVNQE